MDSSKSTEAIAAAAATTDARGRNEEPAAGAPPDPLSARDQIAAEALRNASYHEDRTQFFAAVHRWMMFFVVFTGSTAFVALAGYLPVAFAKQAIDLAGPIAAMLGLFDLVFDPSGKARVHDRLRRESVLLLADIQDRRVADDHLEGALTRLYADDPPTMHAVNALAYNRAMLHFGRERKHLLVVGWFSRAVRHFLPFGVHSFSTNEEMAVARKTLDR